MAEPANQLVPADTGGLPMPAGGVDAFLRTETETQVATAKKYPRNVANAVREAELMACLDDETAHDCFYALPRRKRVEQKDGTFKTVNVTIEGPSIRLAEIFASAWGNLRWGAFPVGQDKTTVTVHGFCHDLEKNVARSFTVSRRIVDRNGRRYNDDMLVMTQNAAMAIAARNAVFAVVPRAYAESVMRKAREKALGKDKDTKVLEGRRAKALEHFAKMGVSLERILAALGLETLEDVDAEHVLQLRGAATAIKDGDATVDETFPPLPGAQAAGAENMGISATEKLKGELAGKLPKDVGREPKREDAREPGED